MIKQVTIKNKTRAVEKIKVPIVAVEGDLSRLGADKFRRIEFVPNVRVMTAERREEVYGRD